MSQVLSLRCLFSTLFLQGVSRRCGPRELFQAEQDRPYPFAACDTLSHQGRPRSGLSILMVWGRVGLIAGTVWLLWMSCAPARADAPIVLTVTPDTESLPADGHSQANITIEAWLNGMHYTGPLQVQMRTSLGQLDPTNLSLNGGSAWTHLRSGAATGPAVLTLQVVNGPRQLVLPAPVTVAFVPPGVRLTSEDLRRYISLRADYLAYSVDYGRFKAVQRAELSYHGFKITADSLTLDASSLQVRARSLSSTPVHFSGPAGKVQARQLFVDLNVGIALAMVQTPEGAISLKTIKLGAMVPVDMTGLPAPDAFAEEDITGSALTIRARRIDFYPNVELRCAGASILISGKKALYLPFYRYSLNPYNPNGDQYVTLDSYSGVGINIPIYYMLNDQGMGSVRITHQERSGYFGSSTPNGWALGIRQDYGQNAGSFSGLGGVGGSLSLDRITSRDWGMSWRHNERFARSALLNTYFYTPDHRAMTGDFNIYAPWHGLGLSMATLGNHQPGLDALSSQLNVDFPQQSLFKRRVAMNFSSGLSWQYLQSRLNGVTGGGSAWIPGMAANVYMAPWTLGSSTTLTPSVVTRLLIPNTGAYQSTNAGLALNRQFGTAGGLSLNYNWSVTGANGSSPAYSHQLLSAYLYAQALNYRLRWSASPSYDLTDQSTFLLSQVAFLVTPQWAFDSALQLNSGGGISYDDWQVGVSHPFLGRSLRLFYQESTHKIRLEITSGQLGW